MSNVFAWFLFFMSFTLFFMTWKKVGLAKSVLIAGFLGIASHHLLSFLNVIIGPFFFTQYDAYFFHDAARSSLTDLSVLHWSLGSELYRSMLTVVYSVFGSSLWLGQSVSVLFFAMALGVLARLMIKLEMNNNCVVLSLLLFSLIPSSLMFGAYTLRETFFTFFLMFGVYTSYLALFNDLVSKWKYYLIAMMSFLAMGVFHIVLLVYAVLINAVLLLLLCWQERENRSRVIGALLIFTGICFIFIAFPELLPISIGDNYFAMLDIRLAGRQLTIPEAIHLYHQSTNESAASTQYVASLDFSTWLGMFAVMLKSYVFYMVGPFTGPFSSIDTYVLLFEAVIRVLGLLALINFALRDKRWLWLLFVYFSLTFLWNIGTTNHGQALRHHFMTEWLPIMALSIYAQKYWFVGAKAFKKLVNS